jgi:hypothetical protein
VHQRNKLQSKKNIPKSLSFVTGKQTLDVNIKSDEEEFAFELEKQIDSVVIGAGGGLPLPHVLTIFLGRKNGLSNPEFVFV